MKIKLAILPLLLILHPLYCGDFNPSFSKADLDNISLPVPQKTIDIAETNKATTIKKWTIMVFLNGKNDLEMAGLFNMNQMEMVGSNKDINIVVEMGRMNGQQQGDTDLDGNWTGVRRYYVKKDNDPNHINSRIIFKSPSYDMGNYKRAANFLKWTKKHYPARKYMLILWDHGTGWMDPRQKNRTTDKGISFDDETGNYIRTKQIGDILREGGRVDILAFDACLMQMAEVLTEVKDKTKIVVGSEETIPGTGYPYNLWLAALAERPDMSEEDLAAIMVESYKLFYEHIGESATLSAIRSSKISGLNTLLADFATLAMQVNDIEAIKKARQETIRFDVLGPDDADKTISFFADIYHFADIMSNNLTKTDPSATQLKTKAEELKKFISDELVIHRAYHGNERTGKSLANAHGISVYIPPANTRIQQAKLEAIFESPYSTFKFNKITKWHDFVNFIYTNIR